jgi:hypothetical protein
MINSKSRLFLFSLILLPMISFSQQTKEIAIKTNIEKVTVFREGAQIYRKGETRLNSGETSLKIKGLSPYLDPKSIQVNAMGDFVVLAINHEVNYLEELELDRQKEIFEKELADLDKKLDQIDSRKAVLDEKQSLLNANKTRGGVNNGATISQLNEALNFFETQLTQIKTEHSKIRQDQKALLEQKEKIQKQLNDTKSAKRKPSGEIEIKLKASVPGEAKIEFSYMVSNAGWYPKYDIRVDDIEKPLNIQYKAEVYQNTGIDWEKVKLTFSNGNPNQSGVAPELRPWRLNYARNTIYSKDDFLGIRGPQGSISGVVYDLSDQMPLPGVNIQIPGSTLGTVTDLQGRFSLTLPKDARSLRFSFVGFLTQELPISGPQITVGLEPDTQDLEELVVVGYGVNERNLQGRVAGVNVRPAPKMAQSVTTITVENQISVEFEVEEPYSVASNGRALTVDLKNLEIETVYEYYAIPKIDKDAFLVAKIINWDQYNLLEGEANLYFEKAYIGRTILDVKNFSDTLNISLGRDRNILLARNKVDEYSKRRTIGANQVETRGFDILVRNKKSQAIRLILFDQIPVAAISEIGVLATELSLGHLEPETGEIRWELDIPGQQQQDLKLQYEVKYPKRERVILE